MNSKFSHDKIVILAGGLSSRMKLPLAEEMKIDETLINEANNESKSMIGLGKNNRPFLDYLLFNIEKSGYKNVLIVIGENDDKIRQYYTNKSIFPNLEISFAIQQIFPGRKKPYGTADALFQGLQNTSEWRGSQFTVINSDNLYSINALELMRKNSYKCALIAYDSKGFLFEKERIENFAILVKDEKNFLVDILEKPSHEQINSTKDENNFLGVSMNIFKLDYNLIFDYLKNCPVNPTRDEKELPTAIKNMIEDFPKSLYCFQLKEHVPDLTNKQDILPVQKYITENFSDFN